MAPPGSATSTLLRCTGPLAFNKALSPGAAAGEGSPSYSDLSKQDPTRSYFDSALRLRSANGAFGGSFVRNVSASVQTAPAAEGASDSAPFDVLVLSDVRIELAKDATSVPLRFSTKKDTLNEQFELGFPPPTASAGAPAPAETGGTGAQQGEATASAANPVTPSAAARTEYSGIDRFPGHLIFGLENADTASGGFETLGDLYDLVGLSAAPWLKLLLSATKVDFRGQQGSPSHNAIWYLPGDELTCCVRLEARLGLSTTIGKYLDKYLSPDWKQQIPHLSVVAKRTVVPHVHADDVLFDSAGQIVLGTELDVGVPRSLGVYVSILEDELTFILVSFSPEVGWDTLKTWLMDKCKDIEESLAKLESDLSQLAKSSQERQGTPGTTAAKDKDAAQGPSKGMDGVYWRRLSVTLSEEGIEAVSIELEACLSFLVPQDKHAGFDMTFTWQPGQFEFTCAFMGRVSDKYGANGLPVQYNIDYERWTYPPPLFAYEDYMSLRWLHPDKELTTKEIPYGVPTEIAAAELSISNTCLSFEGDLQSIIDDRSPTDGDLPAVHVLEIEHVDLHFALNLDYSERPTKVSASLEGIVTLAPYYVDEKPAQLAASISYGIAGPEAWSFSASVERIWMTSFHSLFPAGPEQDAVMSMLENIELVNLSIDYNYAGAAASSVAINAEALIAGLDLRVEYSRSSAMVWSFEANLIRDRPQLLEGQTKKVIALSDAVQDILGGDVAGLLPAFVGDTELVFSGSAQDKLEILCKRLDTQPPRLVFGAELQFGFLRVHLTQVADVTPKKKSTTTSATKAQPPSVKRLVRVSLGPLPTMQSLPLIGALELPCDTIEFLWLSAAMTADDLTALNGNVDFLATESLQLKDGDTELREGFHFRLVGKKGVMVDHSFQHDAKKAAAAPATEKGGAEKGSEGQGAAQKTPASLSIPAPTPAPAQGGSVVAAKGKGSAGPPGEAASMTPIAEKKGPIKLSGIGITFEKEILQIHLDASVLVGPIGAGVSGLTVRLDISKTHGLHNLLSVGVSVHIDGFEVSFDRAPVLLAGALLNEERPESKRFSGGIALSLKALSVGAMGMYEQVYPTAKMPAYDSFFVYASIEGTLFTVGWAEVRGLIAGFGYNSRLRLPPVEKLMDFPLLTGFQSPDGGISILHALKVLTGGPPESAWVSASLGSLWFAAGLVIRACQVLDVRAVATLALGPDQKELGLLARATASLPRGSPPNKSLMFIDLSVLGKLDLVRGELAIDGLINPASFILDHDCRPSGGFAVRSWFDAEMKNPHAGDWVVSVGGFHPRFVRPAHYPDPPRLRISWTVSSALRVTGEAYAAVTPGALMAGGKLQAVFNAGPLSAHFDAHADFLVNLHPLHFEADVGVSAGVTFEVRVWFVRVKMNIEIGASLHLEGPPMGGVAEFHVAIVSFTVRFGSRGAGGQPPALHMGEFLDLVLRESAQEGATDPRKSPHVLSVLAGRVPPEGTVAEDDKAGQQEKKKKEADEVWLIRYDGFSFRVRSPVPLEWYSVVGTANGDDESTLSRLPPEEQRLPVPDQREQIISRPMHMRRGGQQSIQSYLTIGVFHAAGAGGAAVPTPSDPVAFRAAAETWDLVPGNLWGSYSDDKDDYLHPERSQPTVRQLMGFVLAPPLPISPRAGDHVPVIKTIEDTYEAQPGVAPVVPVRRGTKPGLGARYTDDTDEKRERVRWSRVRSAMSGLPGSTKVTEVARPATAGTPGTARGQGGPKIDPKVASKADAKAAAVPQPLGKKRASRILTIGREDILAEFLSLTRPVVDGEPPEVELMRSAYRRIGAGVPRVVLDEPERFYRSPPTVFCT